MSLIRLRVTAPRFSSTEDVRGLRIPEHQNIRAPPSNETSHVSVGILHADKNTMSAADDQQQTRNASCDWPQCPLRSAKCTQASGCHLGQAGPGSHGIDERGERCFDLQVSADVKPGSLRSSGRLQPAPARYGVPATTDQLARIQTAPGQLVHLRGRWLSIAEAEVLVDTVLYVPDIGSRG